MEYQIKERCSHWTYVHHYCNLFGCYKGYLDCRFYDPYNPDLLTRKEMEYDIK